MSFPLTSSLFCSDGAVVLVFSVTFVSSVVLNTFRCRDRVSLSLLFFPSVTSSAYPTSILFRGLMGPGNTTLLSRVHSELLT